MKAAIAEAEAGVREGGIPIGAVLATAGASLAAATTGVNAQAGRPPKWMHWRMPHAKPPATYPTSVIYMTLSPCAMCSGAVLLYGIPKVIAGDN